MLQNHLYLGMELIGNGTLKELMDERFSRPAPNNKFSDLEASQIIQSILKAISYIHDRDVSHRDLKPQNILVKDKSDASSLKIIDFGLGDK